MEYAIETRQIGIVFPSSGGAVQALNNINLKVESGSVFGFIGPNGAGKTTAMQILLGFIEATRGEAFIFGTDVRKSIARQNIGYLQEHPDTYRFLTGIELLNLTGRLFGLGGHELKERINQLLDRLELSTEAAGRRIGTYSRGMMQRICLAQALINDPALLILDEPTGGLDPIGRLAIRELIKSLKEEKKTVFFSSHELSEVELICDRIAIISHGKIISEGLTNDILGKGINLEKYFMDMISLEERAGKK